MLSDEQRAVVDMLRSGGVVDITGNRAKAIVAIIDELKAKYEELDDAFRNEVEDNKDHDGHMRQLMKQRDAEAHVAYDRLQEVGRLKDILSVYENHGAPAECQKRDALLAAAEAALEQLEGKPIPVARVPKICNNLRAAVQEAKGDAKVHRHNCCVHIGAEYACSCGEERTKRHQLTAERDALLAAAEAVMPSTFKSAEEAAGMDQAWDNLRAAVERAKSDAVHKDG